MIGGKRRLLFPPYKRLWPRLRSSVQASMPFVAALIRFLWQQSWQRLFQTVGDGTL